MSLPTGVTRPTAFGGLQGRFQGVLSGQRLLSTIPRLNRNAMLMARFMPDTVDLTSKINASKGAGTAFIPLCLSFGAPKTMSFGGVGAGLSGFGAAPTKRYTIWGLFCPETMEPQMFVTVTEYAATVMEGATAVSKKFLNAEFAKAKSDPMSLTIFEDDPEKVVSTTFPAEAGHALFAWQLG